jgi:3-oxoacyl-[acyl-carrier protein] reductase
MTEHRKVAVITGASQGIGAGLVEAYLTKGYRVVATSRSIAPSSNPDVLVVAGDIGDPATGPRVIEEAVRAFGRVDTLVNNAGMLVARPFLELTLEDWDATMRTNLRSLFLVTREVLPGMRTLGRGDIVNVSSLAGRNGFVGGTAYVASKHAVLGFSRSLMLEERKNNIRVIAVCPGSVDTGMLADQPLLPSVPGKILRPEDVAETVLTALQLPGRALVSELDIRPTNP